MDHLPLVPFPCPRVGGSDSERQRKWLVKCAAKRPEDANEAVLVSVLMKDLSHTHIRFQK